jgi:N-acetylmuramoyl-L-alanine amidase
MPAILIETGFITNHDDERYLNSEEGQDALAKSIAQAIIQYKQQMEAPKPVTEASVTDTNSTKTNQ